MYYKKVNLNSNKECFDFLTNHFHYDTLNSWNGVKSIANNVKIWNLPVDDDDALKALEEDNYWTINMTIRDWEREHPGTSVGFNGRSGGYLVLYKDKGCAHIFDSDPCSPCKYDNYEDWKEDVQEYWGSLKAYHSELEYQVKLVQDFDKLCDDLIEVLKGLIADMKEEEKNTHEFKCTRTFSTYTYDTLEDLRAHKQYMLKKNYMLMDYNEDELYAEYSMNELEEGEVVYNEGE